eukprot:5756634-Alexandrium_andersonii.AAC.1
MPCALNGKDSWQYRTKASAVYHSGSVEPWMGRPHLTDSGRSRARLQLAPRRLRLRLLDISPLDCGRAVR